MSERSRKLRIALKHCQDLEQMRQLCLYALSTLEQCERPPTAPGNYAVYAPNYEGYDWWKMAAGSRDYCVGYAEATPGCVVACADFICWPNDLWGDALTGRRHA